jgi:Spy/CpxP family protein refolding chaperone
VRAALEKLDLTQAQKDRLRELAEAARPGLQAQREQWQADRAALRVALDAPKADATTIGTLMLKMKQGREVVKGERQQLHDATLDVLTSEQRIRFEAYLDAFKTMRHRGRDAR